ncbi:MAG: TrmH family RNA methyltransferase, partial [Pseudomonadota bacterium]
SPEPLLSTIVSLDMSGAPLHRFFFPEKFLLLPGMEGRGLPAALRQKAVSIPISSAVESLNAAIATSIALFYWQTGTDFNKSKTSA